MRKSWKWLAECLTSEYMHILYGPQLLVPYSWAGRKHLHTLWASHTQLLASGQPWCWASRQGHRYQGHGHFQQFLWNTKAPFYINTPSIWTSTSTLFADSSVLDRHSIKTGLTSQLWDYLICNEVIKNLISGTLLSCCFRTSSRASQLWFVIWSICRGRGKGAC